MDYITQICEELIKLNEECKTLQENLDEKKARLFDLFTSEDIDSKELNNYKIYKIPENEQLKIIKTEDILNVLTDNIEEKSIIEEILSQILKKSKIKSHIRITKQN